VFIKRRVQEHEKRSIQLVTEKDMPFAYVEAYKALRTNLNFISAASGTRAIVITSTQPEEGKSNVAVNLALTLAEGGKSVALLDCDMRKPVLHKYLELGHNHKGLSNVLAGELPVEEAMRKLDIEKIHVLPAGTPPPNPSELLGQKQMEELLGSLRSCYDYVILDAPPLSMVTDAAILGHIADGVLFVVRSSRISADAARAAMRKLQQINVKVLGAVLTCYNAKKALKGSGYSYSYGYGYGYSYSDRKE
jgi:capsular exopolysaccharide synthesis family protein